MDCFLKEGVILGNVTVAGCWSNAAVRLRRQTSETKNNIMRIGPCIILIFE